MRRIPACTRWQVILLCDVGCDGRHNSHFLLLISTGTGPSHPNSAPFGLPKDLPKSIKYLNDQDLVRLFYAAIDEVKRRRGLTSALKRTLRNCRSAKSPSKLAQPPSRHREVGIAAASLTCSQINAVRAAFNAGTTSSRIARQFGLSQSDVRKHYHPTNLSDDGGFAARHRIPSPSYRPACLASHISKAAASTAKKYSCSLYSGCV